MALGNFLTSLHIKTNFNQKIKLACIPKAIFVLILYIDFSAANID
jgi:hypothetical protein